MGDFLGSLVLFALAGVVGLLIGGALLFVRTLRDKRNWPNDEKRTQLLAQVQEWKGRGIGYSGCLELLMKQGLRKAVADALLGEAQRNVGRRMQAQDKKD